jgi:hypothetical protein
MEEEYPPWEMRVEELIYSHGPGAGYSLILGPRVFDAASDDIWWRAELPPAGIQDIRLKGTIFENGVDYRAVMLIPYEVVKTTRKGVFLRGERRRKLRWFEDGNPEEEETFFVLGTARKQQAVPTIDLAIQELRRRLEYRLSRLSYEHEMVRDAIRYFNQTEEAIKHGCSAKDQPIQDPTASPATLLGVIGYGHRVHRGQLHPDHVHQRQVDQVEP